MIKVKSRISAVAARTPLRFLSPLIGPDVPVSGVRLSDRGRGCPDLIETGEGVHPSPYYVDISRSGTKSSHSRAKSPKKKQARRGKTFCRCNPFYNPMV
jgi:hypothetical protein